MYGAVFDIEAGKIVSTSKHPYWYSKDYVDYIEKLARPIIPLDTEKSFSFKSAGVEFTIIFETEASVILYDHSQDIWMPFTRKAWYSHSLEDERFTVDTEDIRRLALVEFGIDFTDPDLPSPDPICSPSKGNGVLAD